MVEALGAVEASVSLNRAIGSDGDGELGDLFVDPEAADPVEEAGESLRRQAVRDAVGALPDRERRDPRAALRVRRRPSSRSSRSGRELGHHARARASARARGARAARPELEGVVDAAADAAADAA